MEGDIEDHASNLPLAAAKALHLVDNLYRMVGMEALYAAQAVDLREGVRLGRYTQIAYDTIRAAIPTMDENRAIGRDLEKAYELVRSGRLLEACRTEDKAEQNAVL